jgi:hypothetical protein
MQGLQAQRQNMTFQQQNQEEGQAQRLAQQQQRAQAQQQEQAARQQGAELLQSGSPVEIAQFMIKNKNVAKDFTQAANFKDTAAMGSRVDYAKSVISGRVPARQAIDAQIKLVESRGGDAQGLIKTLAMGTDEAIIEAAQKDLAMLDPKSVIDYNKAMGLGQDGAQNLPAETLAFNDLIKDFSPEQKKVAKQIKAGLKGRAVSNAEMTAIEDGSITSYSDYKVKQKELEKFAEATGSSRAKIIDNGFVAINKFNASLGNIDRAIDAINRGAGTGAVEKFFPSIKAASVELENIRNSMALDVVGATTFGALSAGELSLAKDVALPTGLDKPELLDYLARKKAAQEKLRDYYMEQIQFIDQKGTVAGFLRMKEREKAEREGGGQVQQGQAQQPAAIDFSQVSDEDLFN